MAIVPSNAIIAPGMQTTSIAVPQMEDQVQGGLFLNVVIRKSVSIFQLLACKDESLLGGVKDVLSMLDLNLHILDNTGLHL